MANPNKMVNKGQTTTTSEPWKQAQPYMTGAMEGAQGLLDSGAGFNPYQGQMVANMSGQTQGALQGIQNLAQQPDTLLGAAKTGLEGYASGAHLNGGSPEFQNALNYQTGQMTDDVNRGFSVGGRYGSGAHVGVLGDTVGQFRNQAMQGELARQQGLQMQAIGMAPGMSQAQYQPMQNLANVGAMYDQHNQMNLDAERERYEQGQMSGWNRLNAFNQVVGPYGQMGGTQVSQLQERRGFPVLRALGGMAATAIGALSDRRFKEGIRRVGTTEQGVPVYVYRYRGEHVTHMGIMADEAPPEAVHEIEGVKYVDYSKVA